MNANLLLLAIGILFLMLGRKLFWLVVAVMGFASGLELAAQFIHAESKVVILSLALAMGILGGILAIFLQYAAVGLAGFAAGAHLIPTFSNLLNLQGSPNLWLFSLLGGVMMSILALSLLNWALVILSSLVGAGLVCQALTLQQTTAVLVFVILVAVGIILQSNLVLRRVSVG
jgi:hypothetical protein